jgi:hypothetical protein
VPEGAVSVRILDKGGGGVLETQLKHKASESNPGEKTACLPL